MTSTPAPARRRRAATAGPTERPDAAAVVAQLRSLGSKRALAGYARFAIDPPKAFGMDIRAIQQVAKQLGTRHDLVDELWASGWYEARLLCAFVADAAKVTKPQMQRWCRDFDNWGIVDTLCFKLWDRTPHAFAMVDAWRTREPEFEKRAAFALLASVALHIEAIADAPFVKSLQWIEAAATDERNFVKKGVLWALRGVGGRNRALHTKALALADRLARSSDATSRWLGKNAARELRSAATTKRLAQRG